jgi:hypothetical protein
LSFSNFQGSNTLFTKYSCSEATNKPDVDQFDDLKASKRSDQSKDILGLKNQCYGSFN